MDSNSGIWCFIYGMGIIVMLGAYGVIQEKIMTVPYGKTDTFEGELFKTSVFLVFCNRVVAILYASGMTYAKKEEFSPKAPLWKYLAISFSNVAATWCQYEALKWVSFPVQMLGKSFKMMPVMVWSIVISGKKYEAKDWLIAGGVTWGVTQFLLTGEIKSKHADKGSSVYGLILMGGFLGCDGFTSTFQEKVFKDCKTTKYNQMLYVNAGSAVVSLSSFILSGAAPGTIAFCFRHSDFVVQAMTLSASAVAGQYFIYSQVKEFGALVLAATMNLRQVISIMVSFLLYGHRITFMQILGLVMVFGALFYKTYLGYKGGHEKPKNTPKSAKVEAEEAGDEEERDRLCMNGAEVVGKSFETGDSNRA
jgi:adenosine 3'-phospho 5'-phosphosulfate transporter B2